MRGRARLRNQCNVARILHHLGIEAALQNADFSLYLGMHMSHIILYIYIYFFFFCLSLSLCVSLSLYPPVHSEVALLTHFCSYNRLGPSLPWFQKAVHSPPTILCHKMVFHKEYTSNRYYNMVLLPNGSPSRTSNLQETILQHMCST